VSNHAFSECGFNGLLAMVRRLVQPVQPKYYLKLQFEKNVIYIENIGSIALLIGKWLDWLDRNHRTGCKWRLTGSN